MLIGVVVPDMRALLPILLLSTGAWAATLEKLTMQEMTSKATTIVRGRVQSARTVARGQVLYTISSVTVTENWKGEAGGTIEVATPGGKVGGLTQTFSGVPVLGNGKEYLFFLWRGKDGLNKVIGLSQGLFDIAVGVKGETFAVRQAVTEGMVDAAGQPVSDSGLRMRLSDLRSYVQQADVEAAER